MLIKEKFQQKSEFTFVPLRMFASMSMTQLKLKVYLHFVLICILY